MNNTIAVANHPALTRSSDRWYNNYAVTVRGYT